MSSGILEVQLVDAQGLGSTDLFNKMDPYVVVQYRSQEQKSKVAREEGKNPVWNETLKFKVQHSGSGQNQHKLHLRIMDHDTFTRDDFVGETTIHVSEVIESGLENGFFEHKPTKYNVVLADRSYCGSIRVGLTFTKTD